MVKPSVDTRKPYGGNTRSLAIAIDVGTTFSGVSYAFLVPNEIPKIIGVTQFPGQENVYSNHKIPSIMYYDAEGRVMAAGAEAVSNGKVAQAEDEEWIKAELFKLRLRPRTMKLNMNGMRLSPLPKGKTAVLVFGDFLAYLFRCTRAFITDTHANGAVLWNQVQNDIQFVLSHPNGWEGAQQTKMRRSAIYGGLIPDTNEGKARIRFVTEGEASLHACVQNGLAADVLSSPSKHGFLIADAGGGTLDISSYAIRSIEPLTMEEIAPPDCIFAGSVFVSRRARDFLAEKLKGSRYGSNDAVEHITKRFDETTKQTFRSKDEHQYIKFGSPLDKDPAAGIRNGQLKLIGVEVASLFEPSVAAAFDAIKAQIDASNGVIKSVFLVGGYAASPWLFGQLQERLTPLGVTVSKPDTQTSKAVADGAIGFYCDHHVSARMSKFMYGVEFLRELDPMDPDHIGRRDRLCELPSGPKLLPDAFDCILARGVKVKESSVFSRKYCTELTSLTMLSVFEVEVWCYRGENEIPKWINRQAEDFSTLCVVQADLSPLSSSAEAKTGPNGKKYWTIVFSVEIHFGLTEFKARIKWVDAGRILYGPASIIYNERGHRADEDDEPDAYPEDDSVWDDQRQRSSPTSRPVSRPVSRSASRARSRHSPDLTPSPTSPVTPTTSIPNGRNSVYEMTRSISGGEMIGPIETASPIVVTAPTPEWKGRSSAPSVRTSPVIPTHDREREREKERKREKEWKEAHEREKERLLQQEREEQRRAQEERVARAGARAEQRARAKEERERLQREREEYERQERERVELERLAWEQAERERLAREEEERVAWEQEEHERRAREQAERERHAELERQERERAEQERKAMEQEEYERQERERLSLQDQIKEDRKKQREAVRLKQQEKLRQQAQEREEKQRQAAEAARLAQEEAARKSEGARFARLEKARLEEEERARAEAERVAALEAQRIKDEEEKARQAEAARLAHEEAASQAQEAARLAEEEAKRKVDEARRTRHEKKRLEEEAKAEKKRLEEEAKAEKKRLEEEAAFEKKRQEEDAKAEQQRLEEEAKAEKERLEDEAKAKAEADRLAALQLKEQQEKEKQAEAAKPKNKFEEMRLARQAKAEQKRLEEEAKLEKKRLEEEAKAEKQRLEEEARAEKQRLEEEAKAEKKRLEEEATAKAEADRLAALEAKRLKEQQEKEKQAAAAKPKTKFDEMRLARLEKKRLEEEAKAKAEADRLAEISEKERLQKEAAAKAEAERLERERLEAERLEQERLERERLEAERLEQERQEKERQEAEERARREAEEEAERQRLEKERLEAEAKAEQERLAEEARIERERQEAEAKEKERQEAEARAEKERLEAEEAKKTRMEVIRGKGKKAGLGVMTTFATEPEAGTLTPLSASTTLTFAEKMEKLKKKNTAPPAPALGGIAETQESAEANKEVKANPEGTQRPPAKEVPLTEAEKPAPLTPGTSNAPASVLLAQEPAKTEEVPPNLPPPPSATSGTTSKPSWLKGTSAEKQTASTWGKPAAMPDPAPAPTPAPAPAAAQGNASVRPSPFAKKTEASWGSATSKPATTSGWGAGKQPAPAAAAAPAPTRVLKSLWGGWGSSAPAAAPPPPEPKEPESSGFAGFMGSVGSRISQTLDAAAPEKDDPWNSDNNVWHSAKSSPKNSFKSSPQRSAVNLIDEGTAPTRSGNAQQGGAESTPKPNPALLPADAQNEPDASGPDETRAGTPVETAKKPKKKKKATK